MASKAKIKNYIVHHNGYCRCLGRYRIGAKNEKEAESLLRNLVGKHEKVRVYFELNTITLKRGEIIKE